MACNVFDANRFCQQNHLSHDVDVWTEFTSAGRDFYARLTLQ